MLNDKTNQEIDYFIAGQGIDNSREVSTETSIIHEEYSEVFTGIGCFKGMFSLQK